MKMSALLFFSSLCYFGWGQENCSLNFNGYWSIEKHMDVFEDFTLKHGSKRSKSAIQIEIHSELDGNPDPSPEQIRTYTYICENQNFIRSVLLDSSKVYFQDYFDEAFSDPEFIDSLDKAFINPLVLEQLMTPLEIHILSHHKDGYAYYGIGGHCAWELDEGFGFLLHKKRILAADVIFVAAETGAAMRDNGTLQSHNAKKGIKQPGITLQPKPKLYAPHPKYGMLKPIEKHKNTRFVYDLVAYGYTDDVIALHKAGKIDIQSWNGNRITKNHLRTAVTYNQIRLVKYFLNQPGIDKRGLIQRASKNLNKEMVLLLLEHGIDINERSFYNSQTALDILSHKYHQSHNHYFDTRISEDKASFKEWLITLGAETQTEILEALLAKRDFEGLRTFMKIKSQRISSYIYNALHSEDEEMALFLFVNSNYHNDAHQFMKAFDYKSRILIQYCLEKGIDINTPIRGHLPLEELRKSKKYTSGKTLERLTLFENWMISKGAISKL